LGLLINNNFLEILGKKIITFLGGGGGGGVNNIVPFSIHFSSA